MKVRAKPLSNSTLTSSTQNGLVLCCWILCSRSPPPQYSMTIHRRSSAGQRQRNAYFQLSKVITLLFNSIELCCVWGFRGFECVCGRKITFKCLTKSNNMGMFHSSQQNSFLPRTLMSGPIL